MNAAIPITVIGGGIAGLVSAIALGRAGFSVRVFERSPAPHEIGAGITLWPNAVAILEAWGLGAELRRFGTEIESGQLIDARGRPLLRTPVGAVSREFGSVSLGIHRATLLRILLDAVPADQVTHGAECVGIEDDGDGVTSRFADGHEHRGGLLVGADGIRSTVFRALHGAVPLRYSGYVCYRGIAPHAGADIPLGSAFEAWGCGRRFGVIRLDANRVYWFANENCRVEDVQSAVDLARLRDSFELWPAPIAQVLASAETGDTYLHAIYDRPCRKNQRGCGLVALVGDAAHPMTPDLGQGACQAIEDAAALAHSLARAPDRVSALEDFKQLRWPRVSWIVRRSRFQGWVGQHSTRIGCRVRDLLMRWTPAPVMRKTFRDLVAVQDLCQTSRCT